MAQRVKDLPAVQETWVQSLGREDLLEKGMATHSSLLAWRIPGTGEPGGLQSIGSQRVGHDWVTFPFSFTLQYHVGFCHISTWISYGSIYVPTLPTSTLSTPLCCQRSLDLSSLHHTEISIGYLILHVVMHMVQRCSLTLSHPVLPLLCPQICSLWLHLYCCPPDRLISTMFLDSMCMC